MAWWVTARVLMRMFMCHDVQAGLVAALDCLAFVGLALNQPRFQVPSPDFPTFSPYLDLLRSPIVFWSQPRRSDARGPSKAYLEAAPASHRRRRLALSMSGCRLSPPPLLASAVGVMM